MRGKCQICCRLQRVAADGGIVHHHYRGDLCLGTYNPPVDSSFDAIPAAIEYWTEQDNRCARRFNTDIARRSNQPLPAVFWSDWANAARERTRLIQRLKRLTTGAAA